jgi:hypothetical protein
MGMVVEADEHRRHGPVIVDEKEDEDETKTTHQYPTGAGTVTTMRCRTQKAFISSTSSR